MEVLRNLGALIQTPKSRSFITLRTPTNRILFYRKRPIVTWTLGLSVAARSCEAATAGPVSVLGWGSQAPEVPRYGLVNVA